MYQHQLKVDKIKQIAQAQTYRVSTKWIDMFPPETNIVQLLASNSALLDALKTILVREYDTESRQPRAEYDNQNWALLQADKNGYKRAIENFINLLTIKEV